MEEEGGNAANRILGIQIVGGAFKAVLYVSDVDAFRSAETGVYKRLLYFESSSGVGNLNVKETVYRSVGSQIVHTHTHTHAHAILQMVIYRRS